MVAWLVCSSAEQLGELGLAIIAQVPGHDVESLGQLSQLVVESHGHDLIEVAGADLLGGLRDRANGLENPADRAPGEVQRGRHGGGQDAREPG